MGYAFSAVLDPLPVAAQTPATAKGLQGGLVHFLQPPRLHLALEFLPASNAILLYPMLAQQPVNANSTGAMFRRRQVPNHHTMRLPFGFLSGLGQSLEQVLPVHIIYKNVLPPVAPVHHVVNSARIPVRGHRN